MPEYRRVKFVLNSPDFAEPSEFVASVESLARTAEQLVWDGRTYRVTLVLHNYDDGSVSVYGDEDTS
jgi:hypothetical protein